MKALKRLFLLAFIYVNLVRCNDDDPSPKAYLVSTEFYGNFDKETLQTLMATAGIDLDPQLISHDVEMYRMVYRTTYKGAEIDASGMVAIPIDASGPVDMVSFQHGTIASHADAPSQMQPGESVANLYAALASTGYIVPIPDFIGFGSSTEISHPYYVEEATADAVIDMVRASKEFAQSVGISFSGDLFLAGYSQGGYATLAAHKAIETDGLEGFNLKASFPASGGYDVKGMQEYFFALTEYNQPFYIAYVAHAYSKHYEWSQPFSLIFQEPYASSIPSLFDGSKSADAINDELTDVIADLIHPEVLQNIEDSEYAFINDRFIENSLTDWVPTTPVYFYHGDADITVPYQNSIDTYNTLIANGTSESTITFTTLDGATHSSGIFPYIEEFVPLMLSID